MLQALATGATFQNAVCILCHVQSPAYLLKIHEDADVGLRSLLAS